MELNDEERRKQRMAPRITVTIPAGTEVPRDWLTYFQPVVVAGIPKPRIARNENGRWFVKSAPFTPDEDPTRFWEYWGLLSAAAKWCTMMNEDQMRLQWAGRAKRGE